MLTFQCKKSPHYVQASSCIANRFEVPRATMASIRAQLNLADLD